MPNTIADNLARLQTARTDIANAIAAKGGTVAAWDGFEDFPADIATITNQYAAQDEGKVVSNGALVAQTAYPSTITNNGTYDTTENNSVTVDIPSLPTGIEVAKLTPENDNISDSDMYIINAGNRTYIVGHFKRITGSPTPKFSYPSTFVPMFTKRPSSDSQNYFTTNKTTDAIISYSSGTAYISNNLVTVYGSTAGIIYNYAIMFTTN